MSNYNSLKATIDANIKQNGNQEITGQILNSVLNAMVTTLGTGYQFAGVATIATNPGTPDAKVFYIANGKGTYEKFGGLEVTEDDVVVFYWDSSWHKVATGIASNEKLSELEAKVGNAFLKVESTWISDIRIAITGSESYNESFCITDYIDVTNSVDFINYSVQHYNEFNAVYVLYTADKTFIKAEASINGLSQGTVDVKSLDDSVKYIRFCALKNKVHKVECITSYDFLKGAVIPQMFGAVGDGLHDDTDALNIALKQPICYIPHGIYCISSGVDAKGSIIGFGDPTIKSLTSELSYMLRFFGEESRLSGLIIKNINFDCSNSIAAVHLNNIANTVWENVKFTTNYSKRRMYDGIIMVASSWAHVFRDCSWTRLKNGLKGEGSTTCFETCNFVNCYFGDNENCISAADFSNNHFIGGWMETSDVAFNLTPSGNVTANRFTDVDFENIQDIFKFSGDTKPTIESKFIACAFVNSPSEKMHIVNNLMTKDIYITLGFTSCKIDPYFSPLTSGGSACHLGLPGLSLYELERANFAASQYFAPCPMIFSFREYKIPNHWKFVSNDRNSIRVNLPFLVFVSSIRCYDTNINDISIIYYYNSKWTKNSRQMVAVDEYSYTEVYFAVTSFDINADHDISDKEISIFACSNSGIMTF